MSKKTVRFGVEFSIGEDGIEEFSPLKKEAEEGYRKRLAVTEGKKYSEIRQYSEAELAFLASKSEENQKFAEQNAAGEFFISKESEDKFRSLLKKCEEPQEIEASTIPPSTSAQNRKTLKASSKTLSNLRKL